MIANFFAYLPGILTHFAGFVRRRAFVYLRGTAAPFGTTSRILQSTVFAHLAGSAKQRSPRSGGHDILC